MAAPLSTREQFVDYGRKPDGLWKNFMTTNLVKNAAVNNARKVVKRANSKVQVYNAAKHASSSKAALATSPDNRSDGDELFDLNVGDTDISEDGEDVFASD